MYIQIFKFTKILNTFIILKKMIIKLSNKPSTPVLVTMIKIPSSKFLILLQLGVR